MSDHQDPDTIIIDHLADAGRWWVATQIQWDLDDEHDAWPMFADTYYVYADDQDEVADVISTQAGWCIKTLVVEACDDPR